MTEIEKFETLLNGMDIPYEKLSLYDGFQITVLNSRQKYMFDVICHKYSYGGPKGLLEAKGWWLLGNNGVSGFLTADDVIQMYKEKIHVKK